jgi:hypothetical protein
MNEPWRHRVRTAALTSQPAIREDSPARQTSRHDERRSTAELRRDQRINVPFAADDRSCTGTLPPLALGQTRYYFLDTEPAPI